MKVTQILIYPIKGASAVSLSQASVEPRGLAGDRRWMLVDAEGKFLQQRVRPEMACIQATLEADGVLHVAASGRPDLTIPVPSGSERLTVTVWGDRVDAACGGVEAAAWFSEYLGTPCRLAFMDGPACRPVSADYGVPDAQVSFADTMPVLIASESSLADLNRRLPQPVAISRFRPNVVVDGDRPWSEDDWRILRIGPVQFQATHPCARCVVTTVDQQTGRKDPEGEPLKTLAGFRRSDSGVLFGQNLAPRGTGTVHVGDDVTLETADPDDS